eukprot:403360935
MYLYENQANLILTPAGSATTPLFDSSGYLDQTSYTISGWFYTCQTGDYHIISRQKASTTFNEIFSIRVDGTGQLIVHYLEGTLKTFYTGIYTYAGWNYFALAVKQYSVSQFGTTTYYNDLNFYSGNDQFPSSDQNGFGFYAKIQKFTTTWQRSVAAIQKDFTYTDTKLMIGCRQYEGSTAPELYTGFMHGFIHSFRIYNQAVGLEILSQDWSTECNGACGMCSSIDKQCYDKIQDLFVAKMDFAAGISNNLISDSSGNSNILELSPNPPIYIPEQGLLFKKGKYVSRTSGTSFQLGNKQVFCIESWFKLDFMNQNPNNFIGYLFGKYDTVNSKFQVAIGVSNTFMRVIFGTNYYDKPFNFLDGNWHFIHACFRRSEVTLDTQLLLWIDDQQGADIQTFDGVYTENSAYEVYAGKDLAGVMRTLSITQNVDWDCTAEQSIMSPHITSNKAYVTAVNINASTTLTNYCGTYGATDKCQACSPIQYPSQTSTNQCFSNCSLNSYDKQCIQCDFRCKYCTDNTLLTCSECNEFKFAFKNQSGLCQCAPGFFTNETAKACTRCNESCSLCDNSTNQCLVCAKGFYRIYNNQCVKTCPSGYVGSDSYGICVYAPVEVDSPDYIMGCKYNEYWDLSFKTCSGCNSSCKTCFGPYQWDCLSCERGYYLQQTGLNDFVCNKCDAVGMYYGLSGECQEYCGDSKDFGLNQCEDGNKYNGDGCSSTCQIEEGFQCTRGTTTKAGSCFAIPTQINSVSLTQDNNLLIEFTNDIMILGELTMNDLQVVIYQVFTDSQGNSLDGGRMLMDQNYTTVNWIMRDESYSLMPRVRYLGKGKLRDSNNQDVKANQLSTAYLNYQFIDYKVQTDSNDQTCKDVGLAAASFGLAGMFVNLLSYLITNKSVIPAFYSFISLQSIYLMLVIKNSNYPVCIYSFLKNFDFTLLEFRFIPVFLKEDFIDTYIPRRGIFSDELENLSYYYNTVVYNVFRKIVLWLAYFFVLLPFAGLGRKLFGEDSDIFQIWPDKFFFSGTMIIFFAQIQPLTLASLAEINLERNENSDYEYASYCLACLIIAVISVNIVNSFILIIRHSGVSDHPTIQLRFNTLFAAFKQNQMFSQMFFPILLSAKVILVYAMQFTTDFTNIACIIISAALIVYYASARPFRFMSNTIFVLVSEVLLITVHGIAMSYASSDLNRTDIQSNDSGFMAIVMMGCVANFIWSSYDCAISMIRWKKAKDSGQANPFHLIPSYKYKNQRLMSTTTSNIFEKAGQNIDFTSDLKNEKGMKNRINEDTNLTGENSSSDKKPKKSTKVGQMLQNTIKGRDQDINDTNMPSPQPKKDLPSIDNIDKNTRSFTHFGQKNRQNAQSNNNNGINHDDFESVNIMQQQSNDINPSDKKPKKKVMMKKKPKQYQNE